MERVVGRWAVGGGGSGRVARRRASGKGVCCGCDRGDRGSTRDAGGSGRGWLAWRGADRRRRRSRSSGLRRARAARPRWHARRRGDRLSVDWSLGALRAARCRRLVRGRRPGALPRLACGGRPRRPERCGGRSRAGARGDGLGVGEGRGGGSRTRTVRGRRGGFGGRTAGCRQRGPLGRLVGRRAGRHRRGRRRWREWERPWLGRRRRQLLGRPVLGLLLLPYPAILRRQALRPGAPGERGALGDAKQVARAFAKAGQDVLLELELER